MYNAQPFKDEWITTPSKLIGARVSILWANSQFYQGTVVRYTASSGMHTVRHDDGEERAHDMYRKSFRIEGDPRLWTPELITDAIAKNNNSNNPSVAYASSVSSAPSGNYATLATSSGGGYAPALSYGYTAGGRAPPYISRYPNSTTAITFNVCVRPQYLQPGDRVVLSGSLECMGLWVQPVPLEQSDIDGSIWSCTLQAPLNMADTSMAGIIHYRYEIASPLDDRIPEGQYHRSETRMRRNLFHVFRPNYVVRFRGLKQLSNAAAVEKFLKERFTRLRRGDLGLMKFMGSFRDLIECISNISRGDIESVFNQNLDIIEREREGGYLDTTLCYLGMIGYFGVTSAEKYYQNSAGFGSGYTMSYLGTQDLMHRKPPKPKQWCHFVTNTLATPEFLHADNWKERFGHYAVWVAIGVQEATERLSEYKSYEWLKLYPVLRRFGLSPRVVHPLAKADRDGYSAITTEVCASILYFYAEGSSIQAQPEPTTLLLGPNMEMAQEGEVGFGASLREESTPSTLPYQLSMVHDWLHGLILYAPALGYLSFLFTDDDLADVIHQAPDVVDAFCSRIERETWNSEAVFDTLDNIIRRIDRLRNPRIAAAMLSNKTTTEKINRVLDFIVLCLGSNAYTDRTGSNTLDNFTGGAYDDNNILSSAAKEFFRHHHAAKPATETEKSANNPWFLFGAPTKKQPTAQELYEIRRKCMGEAFDTVSRFFDIPFFNEHSSGLLFELGRSWFFSGEPLLVLTCLVELSERPGRRHPSLSEALSSSFLTFHSTLSAYLSTYIVKAMRASVEESGGLTVMEYLSSSMSAAREDASAQVLVHELLVYVTWPAAEAIPAVGDLYSHIPLSSVLKNHNVWIEAFLWWRGSSRNMIENEGMPLSRIFKGLSAVLTDLKGKIFGDRVQLRDLKCISTDKRALVEVFEQLLIVGPNEDVLPTVEELLRRMHSFESSLNHAQAYTSFFCSCGVKIDVSDIRDLIDSLRARFLDIISSEFDSALNGVQAMPYLAWLFPLRSSDLFLYYWRQMGREVCVLSLPVVPDSVELPPALRFNRPARDRIVHRAIGNTHNDMLAEMMAAVNLRDGNSEAAAAREFEQEEDPLPFVDGFDDDTAANMMAAYFRQQDNQNDIAIRIDQVVLTQQQVTEELIPKVMEKWKALGVSILSRTMLIVDLEADLSFISTVNVNAELKLLSMNDFSGTIIGGESKNLLISTGIRDMNNFFYLCKLRKWIPSLLKLHVLLEDLCLLESSSDILCEKLETILNDIESSWNEQSMKSTSVLVKSVSGLLDDVPAELLNFLTLLGNSPAVTSWLLTQSSTEEFNRLLQVVRPCTDEPRLLSAIASLVYIRTLLLQPLYTTPPYDDLSSLLDGFRCIDLGGPDNGFDSEGLYHLSNVTSSFESLMDVFQRQTISPGIRACHHLVELAEKGVFVLIASQDSERVLSVSISSHSNNANTEGQLVTDSRVESMEYLLDLRSKLLMTEIPEELEVQINASALIDSFVHNFQLLCEMKDILVKLYESGHILFQEDTYQKRFKFKLDSVSQLDEEYNSLVSQLKEWGQCVKTACETYYFLNFFTMREILHLRKLVLAYAELNNRPNVNDTQVTEGGNRGAGWKPPPPPPRPPVEAPPPPPQSTETSTEIENMMAMGFSKEHSAGALRRCGGDVVAAIDFVFANLQYMDRIALEEAEVGTTGNGGGGRASTSSKVPAAELLLKEDELQPLDEILGLLHLVTSRISIHSAENFAVRWACDIGQHARNDQSSFLSKLGFILSDVFDSPSQQESAAVGRVVSLPSENAIHQADMLVLIGLKRQEGEKTNRNGGALSENDAGNIDDTSLKQIPVFVTCTEEPEQVIDTTLSVYVRRGKLPEPGDVVFCTSGTTMEELTLLLRRFVFAKKHGRGDRVFTVADLHKLSYGNQCSFVEKLRQFLKEYGQLSAATLLLVSGLPRQVAMNSLSSQLIDLPPLELVELRRSVKEALAFHAGETLCVASVINGGGKTHYIQSQVSHRQKVTESNDLIYRKIPIRESTDANRLLKLLSLVPRNGSSGLDNQFAFHLDVGHVIPEVLNTMLFQLLYVGVIRDPTSSRCFYRDPTDIYYIEIPNSPNNKTAQALRVCCLLPTVVLHVTADTLDFHKPVLSDPLGTRIVTPEYSELEFVCKWLRAVQCNKLTHGHDAYVADYSHYMDADISREECFHFLCECCVTSDGPSVMPSWGLFHSFIIFMGMQFNSLQEYPLTQSGVLACIQGLEHFKEVFVKLLIETSKDFSLRSVPQLFVVGPLPEALYAAGGDSDLLQDDSQLPDPPSMRREGSIELQEIEQIAMSMASPESIRQSSAEVADRFRNMTSWEQSEHPIVAFKMDTGVGNGVSGVDIISLNRTFLARHIPEDLIQTLETNNFELNRDWSTITNEEGAAILRAVDGLGFQHYGGAGSIEAGYVMTVDNVLKMLSIQLRLRYNLPVIIMGETGCGKSTLIRNMCGILGVALHTLNLHGGMEDQDIINWMRIKIALAEEVCHDSSSRIVLFLDEVNTCNCMGLFKEIVCDRTMNGIPILENVKIIAACNPYRLRHTKNLYGGEEMAGLAFEHFSGHNFSCGRRAENVGTGIKDPLRNLVYRVHPLPESMIDHIFDFGALSSETEKMYIHAMLTEQLDIFRSDEGVSAPQGLRDIPDSFGNIRVSEYCKEFIDVFVELICTAQECVRNIAQGERSVTSLRDVFRCIKVFLWFAHHFADTKGIVEGWRLVEFFTMRGAIIQKYVRKCVILSLAYCYHARLPRAERSVLVTAIAACWRGFQTSGYYTLGEGGGYRYSRPKCPWLKLEANSFVAILEETQREFVSVMNLGEGIALNEALCENLFMILCSILNKIPIFVIGKPGSSKSLAMGLIQSNLNGDASEGTFLKSLPAVEVFSYQCSPLSTSVGIEQAFESSRQYLRQASNTAVVVLLDEVGLAEQSPHLPLKVLHKLLDEMLDGEAMVGISNWSLDPAKMNRAVHLYRPAPTIEDLSLTAEGMVRSANVKGYLQSLAQGYDETYREQEHFDFWGLREFYSTVRAINASLTQQRSAIETESVSLDTPTLLNAIMRNFGGRPHEMRKIINCFFSKLGLPFPNEWKNILVENLIADNLKEPDARHLMLLTKSNAALDLLLDRRILQKDRTEIIFGSDFSLDKTDLYIYLQLQRIKHCMAEGITVVLVNCEALYESLYDLLNQHYVEYGGKIYVRIAFGSYTKLCPLHRSFRVVVIVEKKEAYTKLAPPLLNRFEKQVFERNDVLGPWHWRVLQRVKAFISLYAGQRSTGRSRAEDSNALGKLSLARLRLAFCGFHTDFLSSLILAAEHSAVENFKKDEKLGLLVVGEWKGIDALNACDKEQSMLRGLLEENVFVECIDRLLWISPPEAVCRVHGEVSTLIQQKFSIDVLAKYFNQQRHSSLAWFASKVLYIGEESNDVGENETRQSQLQSTDGVAVRQAAAPPREFTQWRDEMGCQVVVVTHAPIDTQEAQSALQQSSPLSDCVTSIVLHELDQERELRQLVSDFFKHGQSGSTLLVQCDPLAVSKRRIEHTKFIIELARAKRYMQIMDSVKKDRNGESAEATRDGHEEKTTEDGTKVLPLSENLYGSEKMSPISVDHCSKAYGIHVVLLIHLARGDESGADGRYCVDFDTRWRYAFVDALSTIPGLPDVEAMIGKNAVDIFDLLDAKRILLLAFRPSLARLTYHYERTSENVRDQIMLVLRCLETPKFASTILQILKKLIPLYTDEEHDGNISTWMSGIINSFVDNELLLAGTFQSALQRQILNITSTLLMVVLSHMFRNDSLQLYLNITLCPNNSDSAVDFWLYLFEMSFNGPSAVSLLKQSMQSNGPMAQVNKISNGVTGNLVLVRGDGLNGEVFKSRFPFSFCIVSIVDSMRKMCEILDESQLVLQFSTTGLRMNVVDRLPCHMLSGYIYDFMCMRCNPVEGVSREEQAELFEKILSIYNFPLAGQEENISVVGVDESETKESLHAELSSGPGLYYIAQVHWRYWRLERFLSLCFELIDINPAAKARVFEFILNLKELSEAGYLGFLKLVVKLLRPEHQAWDIAESTNVLPVYMTWVKMVQESKKVFLSMLDLVSFGEEISTAILNEWHEVEFLSRFVSDCCIPLEMRPDKVKSYSKRLQDDLIIASPAGFEVVAKLLSEIKRELSLGQQVAEDLICPITQMRFVKPVKAADGMTYEMKAITDWMQKAMTSPMTNEPLRDAILTPDVAISRRLEVIDTCDLNRVLDFYVFDIIFGPGRKLLSPALIELLMKLASGSYFLSLPPVCQFQSENVAYRQNENISLSYSEVLSLCREFFKVSQLSCARFGLYGGSLMPDGDFSELTIAVEKSMTEALHNSFSSAGHLDNMLSTVYLSERDRLFRVSVETYEAITTDLSSKEGVILSCLQQISGRGTATLSPFARVQLDTVAMVRLLLKLGGESVCHNPLNLSTVQLDHLYATINLFLSECGKFGLAMSEEIRHSARMYLLKCIERVRGVSFLRSVLMDGPLSILPWAVEWKQSGDTGFSRFIGSNKIPKWNPFILFPYFHEVQAVVASFVVSKNVDEFTIVMQNLVDKSSLRTVLAAFMLAGFHEVNMLLLLNAASDSSLSSTIATLREWLRSSAVVESCTLQEKEMIEFCVVGLPAQKDDTTATDRHISYSLDKNSRPETVIMYRVMVHVAAILFLVDSSHPFCFLKRIITDPSALQTSFFPTMPEDTTKMAQGVMGGRWYACPNGHPYVVDQCGRPMEVFVCTECGAHIGGEDHNLLDSNKDLGDVGSDYFKKTILADRTERGYCIGSVEQERAENKVYSVRELTPSAVRVIRLLIHTSLYLGSRLASNTEWSRDIGRLLNSSYCTLSGHAIDFFEERLLADWDILIGMVAMSIDDVSVMLHGVLLYAMHVDGVSFFSETPSTANADLSNDTLETIADRTRWERSVGVEFIGGMFNTDSLRHRVSGLHTLCCGQDDDHNGSFAYDLLEKLSVETIPTTDRKRWLSGLWLYSQHFSLDHFTMSLNMEVGSGDSYPVLNRFLVEEPQLRALRFMPSVFGWFRLLHNKCSGRLDRETARTKTIREFICGIDEAERFKFEDAFSGFAAAWNEAWSYVRKYGCIRFPADFNNLTMNQDTPVSFSLPNEQDEGNCPLALAHYLIERHNTFVEAGIAYKKSRQRVYGDDLNKQSHADIILSRFMTNAHTIRYEMSDEIVPYLEKSCVTWNADGAGYEFAKAESFVVDRVLAGLPSIDFELPGFQYTFEQHLQGGLASLRTKVKQSPLSREVNETIRRDISTPALAYNTIGFLETVISFLTATGGAIVERLDDQLGEMLLSEYTSSILMMEDVVQRMTSVQVRLRHIESLWETLTDITSCDIFSKVHSAYKAVISARSQSVLADSMKNPGFDTDTILNVMKSFILDQLQDKVIDANISVAICIGDCEVGDVYLSSTPWFVDYFPKEIVMSEIVEAYKLLAEGTTSTIS